ncbi:MAG: polysaccharide biosynthesis tyrosine autokinase [Bacteroidetes bacterium]|jgi:capsular exopolysaccharide synthesis family protein|nr:polysaccharide biosynthesis tyrosine autokinase [Bacteroidota bacterium]
MNAFNKNNNIKDVLIYFLSYYKLIIGVAFLLLLAAYLFTVSQPPKYKNTVTMHIIESNKNMLNTDISFEMNFYNPLLGMEDELILINSFQTIQETLEQLRFEIGYFKKVPYLPLIKSQTKNIELYNEIPFKVLYDPDVSQPINIEFEAEVLSDSTYRLKTDRIEDGFEIYNYSTYRKRAIDSILQIDDIFRFGEPVDGVYHNFRLEKTNHFASGTPGRKYYFHFNHIEVLAKQYQQNLEINSPKPSSFIINISLKGNNHTKVSDFLNGFAQNTIKNNLADKNRLANNTFTFINNQLGAISDSLADTESNLESFRSSNQVTDLSFQGQRVFDKISEIETEKSQLMARKQYYQYLVDYLQDTSKINELVAPSAMEIQDPVLTNLVTQLVNLNNERRNRARSSATSIYIKELDIKINNLRRTILENARNNLNNINVSISELNDRISKLENELSRLPKTELQLMGIERKFKLNDAIYTYLLEKRAEAQIAKASSRSDYEVVEPARSLDPIPVAPKKSLNLIIALFLGTFFPILGILIKDFLNDKVTNIDQVEDSLELPKIGQILHNDSHSSNVMVDDPSSPIAESFKAIRTNYSFFMRNESSRVVLSVTSSVSGEGKSFCSYNLAVTFAQSGFKTVLLEFDLRRPSIHKMLGHHLDTGLSSYLINQALIENVIHETDVENLNFIPAGTIPPNPSELIASQEATNLIDALKGEYDIVIIDTAPVGIVAESFHLLSKSDLNIVVVRQNHTPMPALSETVKEIRENGIANVALLMNDLSVRSGYTSYKYKYKYSNKYYNKQPRKKGISKLFQGMSKPNIGKKRT